VSLVLTPSPIEFDDREIIVGRLLYVGRPVYNSTLEQIRFEPYAIQVFRRQGKPRNSHCMRRLGEQTSRFCKFVPYIIAALGTQLALLSSGDISPQISKIHDFATLPSPFMQAGERRKNQARGTNAPLEISDRR
jgi:hypothetical protein